MKAKTSLFKQEQLGPLHLRRCHHCNHVNEAENQLVDKCSSCGASLMSFFYFDECLALGLPTLRKAVQKSRLPLAQYPPILGLTVYWELENESRFE